jgi:hypothetical protein
MSPAQRRECFAPWFPCILDTGDLLPKEAFEKDSDFKLVGALHTQTIAQPKEREVLSKEREVHTIADD